MTGRQDRRFDTRWEHYVERASDSGITPRLPSELLAVLRRVWAASDFVAEACLSEPALLDDLTASGDLFIAAAPGDYEAAVAAALARIEPGADEPEALAQALRRLRRREMVRIAWRDLAGWTTLEQTLIETSALAEALIDGALERLHDRLAREHGTPHGRDSGEAQSLVVLGMGKLGARELNFSSDIDLIFGYAEDGETRGRRARMPNEQFFTLLGRELINALDRVTEDGFVYRVDMRLRPYGDSGPLVMSFEQIEQYYQSQGREWERYAMIKARPVGGDRAHGLRLLKTLQPFVYRRYLDFGVFESLREMKGMIDQEAAKREARDNIKIGAGGIREIEFIGQAFQLIRGGREPELREQQILKVLPLLAGAGHLPAEVSAELCEAYRFLRRVENRLQMAADRQTHELPDDDSGRLRLALSMGYAGWEAFSAALTQLRTHVHRHFAQVFAAPRQPAGSANADYTALWQATDADGASAATAPVALAQAGFADPAEVWRRLVLLRESYACRSLSERGRARMNRLMPLLIEAVAATGHPDITLSRVLDLVELIARRTAYLALLADNPEVLTQTVRLCAASPWIARMLSGQPLLLDELIDPRSLYRPLDRAALEQELKARLDAAGADDLEQQMEALRQFKQAAVLRVAAADVMGVMPLMIVSDHLTEIAEVVLAEVLKLATAYLVRRNRTAAAAIERGFAIVAYGKLAGIELGYGSDLDLVFLHADADPVQDSDGVEVYPRLGQRIIHMLGAHTPAGVLYEVDLRLRPSGASGLLVSSVAAFEEYQRSSAWTWEHQALVRARVIAGSPEIAQRFELIRRAVLGLPREPERLCAEIRDMRERMRKELVRGGPGRFDLKQDRGGIADIEFIVQYLVLRHADAHPELLRWTDNIRLLDTLERAGLLSPADATVLRDSYRVYRARVHRLALQEIEEAVVDAGEYAEPRTAVSALWDRIIGLTPLIGE